MISYFNLLSIDYEDLRVLDEDITSAAPSTSEGDTKARYMVQSHVHTRVCYLPPFYNFVSLWNDHSAFTYLFTFLSVNSSHSLLCIRKYL